MGHLLLVSSVFACRVLNYDCNEFVSERYLAESLWITVIVLTRLLGFVCPIPNIVCKEWRNRILNIRFY